MAEGNRPEIKLQQTVVENLESLKITPKLEITTSRLPSFKAPRDLTLSSTSATFKPYVSRTKKNFIPNIPVRREKGEKLPESKSSFKRTPAKSKQQATSRHIKKEKEFIQMQGTLFGEGIADTSLKSSSYRSERRNTGRLSEPTFMQKPLINTNAAYQIDKDFEEKKLREILRDDFIDDPDDEITELFPIRLPMISPKIFNSRADNNNVINKTKKEYHQPTSAKIKEEPSLVEDNVISHLEDQMSEVKLKEELTDSSFNKPERRLSQILSESNNDIMFFQLPNCMPCHSDEVREPDPKFFVRHSQKNNLSETIDVDTYSETKRCTLASLPEGKLGTLKIYESGKAELWLGNHKLEIQMGTQVGFLQDVVRITTDREKKIGSFTVLGHVKHRLVCIPDFKTMAQVIKI